MPAQIAFVAVALAQAVHPTLVSAKTELVQRKGKGSLRATVDTEQFQSDLRDALGEMLGCGDDQLEGLGAIQQKLLPIWNSLPKSTNGRIEPRLLRYIAHRYFMRTSSIMIRGFEPSRPSSQSLVSTADILSQQVPAYVEAALESQHALEHGFTLEDAAHMVAALSKLISDSDMALLEKAYEEQHKSPRRSLSRQGLEQVLQDYMVYWLLGDDQHSISVFLEDRSRLWRGFPRWYAIVELANGHIRALDFERRRANEHFKQHYSFSDARDIVWSITKSFASFWNDECIAMKDMLVNMDDHHTGRVPLSKFYSKKLSTEWRFAESEYYLRQLGALDETSRWHGKEVIIPNYIAAASNCIIATPHYLVCCVDPCESIIGELEAGVGAPVASPGQLLALVGNMTTMMNLDEEESPRLQGSLTRQLDQIAAAHGGKVPLHGRLFAQWLHYAFPRECPFPHKSGTTSQLPPIEFGEYVVKEKDRRRHAENASSMPVTVAKEEMHWMSQWSSEEELISDYAMDLNAPWEVPWMTTIGILALCLGSITGVVGMGAKASASSSLLPMHGKAHFI